MGDEARARERLKAERDEILLVGLDDVPAGDWTRVGRSAPVYVLLLSVSFRRMGGSVRVEGCKIGRNLPVRTTLEKFGLHATSLTSETLRGRPLLYRLGGLGC